MDKKQAGIELLVNNAKFQFNPNKYEVALRNRNEIETLMRKHQKNDENEKRPAKTYLNMENMSDLIV